MSEFQTAVENWLVGSYGENNVEVGVHLSDIDRYVDFVVDVSDFDDRLVGRDTYVIEAQTSYRGLATAVAKVLMVARKFDAEPIIVTDPDTASENAPEIDELRDAVRIVEYDPGPV